MWFVKGTHRADTGVVIHIERIPTARPGNQITWQELEAAIARGTSTVKRTQREWPWGHRLAWRIDGAELLFWFELEVP